MSPSLLESMRALRQRAALLHKDVVSDCAGFFRPDGETFFNFPSKPTGNPRDPFGVTTTCTALMALALSRTVGEFVSAEVQKEKSNKQAVSDFLERLFQRIMDYQWTTAGLIQNNAFTAALVIRACGVLKETGYFSASMETRIRAHLDEETDELNNTLGPIPQHDEWRRLYGKTIAQIAALTVKHVPESLRVQKYPPTAAIGYWLIDGVRGLGVLIETQDLKALARWAAADFRKQMSLVIARHASLRDPVALAMSACLCQSIARQAKGKLGVDIAILPTKIELMEGIKQFFRHQNRVGTWEKYFPLFHYPEAGADYCWQFEVLEAILQEFPDVRKSSGILKRLHRSVRWLDKNELTWSRADGGQRIAHGWNSGGNIASLERGDPECWATGAVHMFFRRLDGCMSAGIKEEILQRYGVFRGATRNEKHWDEQTLDASLELRGDEKPRRLKELLANSMIDPILEEPFEIDLPPTAKRSALLFGPPGTGKTSVVKAIASKLGWDFVEINPSRFLKKGLDGIYDQADQIFKDMRDLYRTVVFFDEMDAMLQRRVDPSGKRDLDVEQQFLTTSMLPHLAELYDRNRVLFFVATNHWRTFDEAITRPGRFDMLLCMGPPDWDEKLRNVSAIAPKNLCPDSTSVEQVCERLRRLVTDHDSYYDGLNVATVKELRGFFGAVANGKLLSEALDDERRFRDEATKWAKHRFALREGTDLRKHWDEEKKLSEIR